MRDMQLKLMPRTTSKFPSYLFKSARDIIRKDKGLNDDIDHLPMP
jgi:hypothetical protein